MIDNENNFAVCNYIIAYTYSFLFKMGNWAGNYIRNFCGKIGEAYHNNIKFFSIITVTASC
jgi:hypothetical protein